MGEQVKLTSLDALENFRAHLIIFMTKAKRAVEQGSDEVRRARHWVDSEQRHHWENQLKRRLRALEQAQQELVSAKYSEFNETLTMQKAAEKKAKRAVEEAEAKLRSVKTWSQRFDSTFDPHVKKLEALRQFLNFDLPKANAYLVQVQRTLDEYTRIAPPDATAPSSPTDATEQQA